MYKAKTIAFLRIALFVAITSTVSLFPLQSYAESSILWDLELDQESSEISMKDFKTWMAKKGFESFKYLFFNREPQYWRLSPCLNRGGVCLVLEDRKSSSHILTKLKRPIYLSDKLRLVMEFMVEAWPKQTDLSKKDKEDAALRIFLTADLDGKMAHLGLAVTEDHAPGRIVVSEREPKNIKYITVSLNPTKDIWHRTSTPIAASFQKAFGSFENAEILSIGLKSDGNNTSSDVKVWLKELKIESVGSQLSRGIVEQ